MQTVTTSIRLEADLVAQYDQLAQSTQRSRNYLMAEALREYLTKEAEDLARAKASIAAADSGEVIDRQQVREELVAMLEQGGVTSEQYAAYAREAAEELREAYDLPKNDWPPCE